MEGQRISVSFRTELEAILKWLSCVWRRVENVETRKLEPDAPGMRKRKTRTVIQWRDMSGGC